MIKTLTYLGFLLLTGCNHYHSKHQDIKGGNQYRFQATQPVATQYQFAHDQEFNPVIDETFYLSKICQSFSDYSTQIQDQPVSKLNSKFNHFIHRYPGYSTHQFQLAQIRLATPFSQSSDQLSTGMKNELYQLQQQIKMLLPPYLVIITGHTSSDGSASFNTALSKRRANRTKAYLYSQGIPDKSMSTVAMADKAPIISLSPALSQELNRRVEILIYQPSTQIDTDWSVCNDFYE